MSFTNQQPFTVTLEDLTRPWSGKKDGSRFRCYLCLKRFRAGDTARWVLNPKYGNFFVCEACDGADVKERFRAIMEPFWERFKALGFGDE